MNKIRYLMLVLVLAVLTLTVASQIPGSNISLEEVSTCTTSFYDEVQNIYGNCIYYHNYTACLNNSGPNTDCSTSQSTFNFSCKTGQSAVTRNSTACLPSKFIVSIDKNSIIEQKEIDFSEWGVCVNSTENNCLIVTCVSNDDGAFKGQFTDCKGGKSCQRFEICDNGIRTFYKNSRNDFIEYDPTFRINQLAIKEVGQ